MNQIHICLIRHVKRSSMYTKLLSEYFEINKMNVVITQNIP